MTRAIILISCCIGSLLSFSTPALAQDRVRVAELSPQAEAAIDNGLRYLAKTQNRDGSFDNRYPVALTALSLMAFMVKGYFPEREPYGATTAKGVDFLLKEARTNGGYMGTSMYEHGLATLALSEVWGESARSDEVRDALKKAVAVIVNGQSGWGGWRYYPNSADQDLSITVMQLVALASAKEAGILVPDATIQRAVRFVKKCQNKSGGFGYRGSSDVSFSCTAAGVTSLLMCGAHDSEEVRRGLAYLHGLRDAPFAPACRWFHYGHYYAAVAMYQAGEDHYQSWYPRARDALVASQAPDGSWAGGEFGGVVAAGRMSRGNYCTPMSILILGVPYRFLPIYQR